MRQTMTLEATTEIPVHITDAQKRQFQEEGYFILERVIPPAQIAALQDEAARFIERMHNEMDKAGTDTFGISHRNKRYFVALHTQESEVLREYVYGDLMAEICRATLGDEAYFFLDQFVVKAAEIGMSFGWHQDGGYVGRPHKNYLTCWATLDDVNEENGTVYLLPYSHIGGRDVLPHKHDPATNDMVGYFGDLPGIPVIVPAGSIAVFGSNVFHRSGANTTTGMRRILLTQYTAEPLLKDDGTPSILAEPFLKDGRKVASAVS